MLTIGRNESLLKGGGKTAARPGKKVLCPYSLLFIAGGFIDSRCRKREREGRSKV